jgi:hypothetical protein
MNWVGAKLEEDAFGAAMLKAGIPADTIMAWTKDPQVEFEGAKGSLFDYLEDLNCDECLSKAMKIAGVTGDVPACANMVRPSPNSPGPSLSSLQPHSRRFTTKPNASLGLGSF